MSWFLGGNRLNQGGVAASRPESLMSYPPPDPNVRDYFTPPPAFRAFGCAGCLIALFVAGGIVGVLVLGWRALLGM